MVNCWTLPCGMTALGSQLGGGYVVGADEEIAILIDGRVRARAGYLGEDGGAGAVGSTRGRSGARGRGSGRSR